MTKQQVANGMLKDFPWDGNELVSPLTLPGALLAPSYIEQKIIATPPSPPAGSVRLYAKSDNKLYQLDSAGNEQPITGISQAQADTRYLQLTGGTLTGPLTVQGGVTAQSLICSGDISGVNVVATTYKWTPASNGEALTKDMPGRLRLSGAQLTVDQNINTGAFLQVAEIAMPVTPGTGQVRVYAKSDHKLYMRDNAGTETDLTFTGPSQAQNDLRYAMRTDTDPFPQYLTMPEGDVRYATNPGGPSGGYVTVASADATYVRQDGTKSMTGSLVFSPDNTVDIGAVGARPRDLLLGRDVVAGRNLTAVGATVSGTASVGILNIANANEQIIWSPSATESHFQMLSADQTANLSGKVAAELLGNAWWNASVDGWRSWDTTKGSSVLAVDVFSLAFYNATATTAGPSWTKRFSVDATGLGYFSGKLNVQGGNIWMGTSAPVTPDLGLYCTTGANWLRIVNSNQPIKFFIDGAAANNWIGGSPILELNSSYISFNQALAYNGNALVTFGGEVLFWCAPGGQYRWVNSNNTVEWMKLVGPNLTVDGTLLASGNITGNNGLTIYNHVMFSQQTGGIGDPNGSQGQLELQNAGGGASKIAFHRTGAYAAYFGLDTDNQWAVGGWSMGGVRYVLITDSQTQTLSNKTFSACNLDGSSTVADGTQHQGWVRCNGSVGIYNSTYGVGIWFTGGNGPQFYAGPNSNEYIQSNARANMIYRYGTGGNVTLDPNSQDIIEFNTGSYVYLPDLNQCWGRVMHVKNMTGAAANVYVTNGNGIYSNTWYNPFLLQHGDSITVHANQAYSGWIII